MFTIPATNIDRLVTPCPLRHKSGNCGFEKRSSKHSLSSSSTRSSSHETATNTYSYTMGGSETNASLASNLCNALNVSTYDGLTILPFPGRTSDSFYTFPECVYGYLPAMTFIELHFVILSGNGSYANPWVRLGMSISRTAESFHLTSCIMLGAAGGISPVDWASFHSTITTVNELHITDMSIGEDTLPTTLPAIRGAFTLDNTDVTGTIPPSFFTNSVSSALVVTITNNLGLTGSIPPNWCSNLPQISMTSVQFDLSSNSLSGSIPETSFGGSWSSIQGFKLNLNNNAFSGNLYNLMASASFSQSAIRILDLRFDNNQFTGSLPTGWFSGSSVALIQSFSFFATNNLLSGLVPPNLLSNYNFGAGVSLVAVSFANNRLDGGLPTDLLSGTGGISSLVLDLSSNLLDGVISNNLFLPLASATSTTNFLIAATNNTLVGDFPSTLLSNSMAPSFANIILFFDLNPTLGGTIPSTFWTSLIPAGGQITTNVMSLNLTVSDSGFTGALDFPDLSNRTVNIAFRGVSADFSSISFAPRTRLVLLDVSYNQDLTGTLPSSLFSGGTSVLTLLNASHTGLTGNFPDVGSSSITLTSLDLSRTSLEFCPTGRTAWTTHALYACDLRSTDALNCPNEYPGVCLVSAVPAQPTSGPVETPQVPVPTGVPIEVPVTPPIGCSLSTRPSPSFVCIGSTWTLQGTVNTTVLTIPGGATQTVVEGNVTSSTVIITGLGSSLIVHGCATNLSLITVELTPEELKQIGSTGTTQTLLTVNSTQCGSTSLDAVVISTHVNGKTCRKVSAKSVQGDGSLSGLFVVSSSGCNVWWIILVSVLGGVLLLTAAVAVAVVLVKKKQAHSESRRLGRAALS